MTPVLIASFAILLTSLSGILFVWKRLGTWAQGRLPYLATCSIGVFGVIIYGLFAEALEHSELLGTLGFALLGAITIAGVIKLVPNAHHHHEGGHHDHSTVDARRMMLGDAVHNIGDGLLLVPAFAAGLHTGIATAIAIFFHEFVQETSEFFVLRQAGYSSKQALLRNLVVQSTILIGVVLSLALSSVDWLADTLIPFAAGGFLYVIIRDLIPHAVESVKRRGKAHIHGMALAFGAIAMVAVTLAFPHSHEEDGAHADELPKAEERALMGS